MGTGRLLPWCFGREADDFVPRFPEATICFGILRFSVFVQVMPTVNENAGGRVPVLEVRIRGRFGDVLLRLVRRSKPVLLKEVEEVELGG